MFDEGPKKKSQQDEIDDILNEYSDNEFGEESEGEEVGRAEAIELLVQRIVDGAQSNW